MKVIYSAEIYSANSDVAKTDDLLQKLRSARWLYSVVLIGLGSNACIDMVKYSVCCPNIDRNSFFKLTGLNKCLLNVTKYDN